MIGQTIASLTREPTLQAAAVVASAPATAAGLRAVGISTDLDTQLLAQGLVDSTLWFSLALAALFGALGGFVAELLSLHGNIELPHRVKRSHTTRTRLADPRDMIDLGVISRMLLGAAAALALLSVYAPTTATALLVNALIAGSAATAVFRLVQGRLLAGASGSKKAPRELRKVPTTVERAA
jgi:hypothetical protein